MSRPIEVQSRTTTADSIFDSFWGNLEQENTKEAALDGTRFIRVKTRQESIARPIFDGSIKLEKEDLDPSPKTDQPRRIEEIEPDSIATYVPFNGTARRKWFKGGKFEIYFGKIESQRNIKNKFNLMTYRNNIKQMLTDNAIYDMADVEDMLFFREVNRLLALPQAAGQSLNLAGGLTVNNVVTALQNLIQRKLPIGKIVMTKSLFMEALKLPATMVGSDIAKRQYDEGLNGKEDLWGYPVITTIKNDIIPDNVFYIFTAQEFLGYHYHLQDATLYIKEEADTYEFWTYEAIGMGIANHRGIVKVTL